MRHLSQVQTQAEILRLGLNQPPLYPFALCDTQRLTQSYDWHAHEVHQLLYALSGVLHLETADTRYLLPPQRAVWIPAGVMHRTWLEDVQSASVFLPNDSVENFGNQVAILSATPLMREMILYAIRWPATYPRPNDLAESFFQTFIRLCSDWLREPLPLFLPQTDHPALIKAMAYTQTELADATVAGASSAAAMSERSFRRHFLSSVGMTWQQYLIQSRMIRAAALLAQPRARVSDVAEKIGFCSLSRFSAQFQLFFGNSPGQYAKSLTGPLPAAPDLQLAQRG